MMRLLFDLGHPAHVHLFRNLAKRVQEEGGDVLAATRHKENAVSLWTAHGLPQKVLSTKRSGRLGNAIEFVERTTRLLRLARQFKPDALLGTSVSIGTVGRLMRRPSFVFGEDDADVVPGFVRIAYSTADYVVTPECLSFENHGPKHLTYPGYHELAYLHPDLYTPDETVLQSLGLSPKEPYFILRFVSLLAHHDADAQGLDRETANALVRALAPHGRVLITAEGELAEEFQPLQFPLAAHQFHDALAFAALCIGDSQTVSAEAAVLGVPNMRCNSFVGRLTYLEELEHRYGLTAGFTPMQTDRLLKTLAQWLDDLATVRRTMRRNRERMLARSVNLTDWQFDLLSERLSLAVKGNRKHYAPPIL